MSNPSPDNRSETRESAGLADSRGLARVWRLSSVGIEMGVAVVIGWAIGFWLDRRFDTGPWLMVIFLLFGVAAGFKGMIRAAREARSAGG